MKKRSQYKHVFHKEWKDDPLLKDWLELFVDDASNVRCASCDIVLPALYSTLSRHAASAQHSKRSLVTNVSIGAAGSKSTGNERKRQKLETIETDCTLELSVYDTTTGSVAGDQAKRCKVDEKLVTVECPSAELTDTNVRNVKQVHRQQQKYVKRWNSDPQLREWVSEVSDDPFSALCRWCNCTIRARYSDLRDHSKSLKHCRNNPHNTKTPGHNLTKAQDHNNIKTQDQSIVKVSPKQSRESGSYLLSHSLWERYRQKYRSEWEQDPLFKGWISPVPGDVFKARCLYCQLLFRAHYKDLKHHAQSTKHAHNVTFNAPLQLTGNQVTDNTDVTMVTNKHLLLNRKRRFIPKKRSRFDVPVASSGLLCGPSVDVVDMAGGLLEPDDSLTTTADLVAMATYNCTVPTATAQQLTPVNVAGTYLGKRILPTRTARAADKPVTPTEAGTEPSRQDLLARLTRSITVWEFLNAKVSRCHRVSTSAASLAVLLTEFQTLASHLRTVLHNDLLPVDTPVDTPVDSPVVADSNNANNILVVENEDLAQFLGIKAAQYFVRDTATSPTAAPKQRTRKQTKTAPKNTSKNKTKKKSKNIKNNVSNSETALNCLSVADGDEFNNLTSVNSVSVSRPIDYGPELMNIDDVNVSNYCDGPIVHITDHFVANNSNDVIDATNYTNIVTSSDGNNVVVCYVTSETQSGQLTLHLSAGGAGQQTIDIGADGAGQQTMSLDMIQSLLGTSSNVLPTDINIQ